MNILTTLVMIIVGSYSAKPQQYIAQPISTIERCICNNVTPQESNIVDFLRMFENSSMTNEIETSEHANELLFSLLSIYPYETIIGMGNIEPACRKRVYAQLCRPIHDGMDICSISNKLKAIRFRTIKHYFISRKVQQVLSSLMPLS